MLPPMRALLFCFAVAACGGSQSAQPAMPPPATAPTTGSATAGSDTAAAAPAGSASPAVVDGMLVKMGEFKDKICACPDQACLEGVQDEMQKWGADLAKQGITSPTLNEDQTKRATALGEALGKCIKRISNMGG